MNRFLLVLLTGCAAFALTGCPQKTPGADAPPPPPLVSMWGDPAPLAADGVVLPQKVTAFRRIGSAFPPYPIKAKAAHEEGANIFKIIIARDGHVRSIRLLEAAYPDLAAAAMESIRHWTYKPYLVGDTPVEVETQVTVNFSLAL